jgi:hypothetical protein
LALAAKRRHAATAEVLSDAMGAFAK